MASDIQAVIWDFGGVISSSPFDAFQRFEQARGLPPDFLRSVNARNHEHNAWARFERNDIDLQAFDQAFADECAALGQVVRGREVIDLLGGEIRPAIYRLMCQALGVAPEQAVFLDDLGVNLKPARALGMRTIKVGNPDAALQQLETWVGFALRGTGMGCEDGIPNSPRAGLTLWCAHDR